jgi:KDO2-lipid IV(A) lauroyltransferase
MARRAGRRRALWWARRWGDVALRVVRLRRAVTLANLRMAFPEAPEADLKRIARSAYQGFAMTMMDMALVPALSAAELAGLSDVEGLCHLEDVQAGGRGGLLVSAHMGNWEVIGGTLARAGYPVDFVVREQKNPLANRLLRDFRRKLGVGVIPVGPSVRRVFDALGKNRLVAILADQDAGRDGVFTEFMGRAASTAAGPALFARRTGAPIVVGYCIRRADGRFLVHLDPPFGSDPSLSEEEDVTRIVGAYTSRLEDFIRRHPGQWNWMHRRWKTRPEEDVPAGGGKPGPDEETVTCVG